MSSPVSETRRACAEVRSKVSKLVGIGVLGLALGLAMGSLTLGLVADRIEEAREENARVKREQLDRALEAYQAELSENPEGAPELDALLPSGVDPDA